MNIKRRTILAVLAVVVGACSGSSTDATDPASTETPTATSAVSTPDTEATDSASPDATTAPEEPTTSELSLADIFDPIAVEPTEPGPRPLLAWESIDGATLYIVVVLGANGDPYWAWSGTETAINVGGIDEPEALGAWVHESMTWTVSAQGPEGEVLALSSAAPLEP